MGAGNEPSTNGARLHEWKGKRRNIGWERWVEGNGRWKESHATSGVGCWSWGEGMMIEFATRSGARDIISRYKLRRILVKEEGNIARDGGGAGR